MSNNIARLGVVMGLDTAEFTTGLGKVDKQLSSFKEKLLDLLESAEEYILFLVDDDIMLEPFTEDCPEFEEFKKNPEIICLSLRQAPYYKGAPVMENNIWNWKEAKWSFGYPMSASSHIFRKSDILPVLSSPDAVIDIPNEIEVELAKHLPDRDCV